eukprot:CAMPEP_0119135988 /NCGR_PEP_ID=MMETSP1310-20130426/20491_1 /TAXON_ID=464262 /ORGANISM="Genus nov. species nov., Strain RCC2339" /LENGTH=185 /DNA_ID=CAMNT_0007126941 /DNA_START=152 /DNA_END=709 /DNA_ORIENTATION=-
MVEPVEELFDIFDEKGKHIGTEKRGVVHKTGLWHRSVDVVLIQRRSNASPLLVIQKRSPLKTVAPSCWDVSCAEHLSPGESFREGAVRGLMEELGFSVSAQQLYRLRPQYSAKLDDEERGIRDYEFKELWGMDFDGDTSKIKIDEDEVVDFKLVSLDTVLEEMRQSPDDYTPWFQEHRSFLETLL